ncbi:MAG: LPS export ABC transporter permease LptF [Alphaproteobacteria bacterium]|nr:LPS export ABC transporter permease LptF [Alphaproteobacteria bacterium]
MDGPVPNSALASRVLPTGLARYLVREMVLPLLFFTGILAGVVWLVRSLDVLEIVLSRGQSATTFLSLSVLVLPSLIPLVVPVSLFLAVLYALHRLQSESELTVIWAAGVDQFRLFAPVLAVAAGAAALVFAVDLWAMPAGYRAFKDRVHEIRGELATAMLREGQFSTPEKGLTIFLGEAPLGGDLKQIFAHDNRNPAEAITYMAKSGVLVSTHEGPRLILDEGNLQWIDHETHALRTIQFDQYTFDLSQFTNAGTTKRRELSERFLGELFHPDLSQPWDVSHAEQLVAEGHARLSMPLYNLAFAAIAFVAVACGPFARRRPASRFVLSTALMAVLLAASLGMSSLTAMAPPLFFLQYALPLGTAAGAVYLIHRDNSGKRGSLDLEAHLAPLYRLAARAKQILARAR